MNCDPDSLLKTKMSDIHDVILCSKFCTNQTLNERFTPKKPRCVFIVNNGYTKSYENNTLSRRVVVENPENMKINQRFSSYEQRNMEDTGALDGGNGNLTKRKLNESASSRRIVLKPSKEGEHESLMNSLNKECGLAVLPTYSLNSDEFESKSTKLLHPTPNQGNGKNRYNVVKQTRRRKKVFKRFRGYPNKITKWCPTVQNNSRNLKNTQLVHSPPVYSPFSYDNSSCFDQSSYQWKQGPPSRKRQSRSRLLEATRANLDDELDKYMSEVDYKTVEEADSVVQEYIMETEKYLNEYDDNQFEIVYE